MNDIIQRTVTVQSRGVFMEHKNYLYSLGEFARLMGVNKRTLHYYNDIDLFCPEIIGENGYHYYTCFQFVQLELILTLLKIGLSVDKIREYVGKLSDESFSHMIEKRKQLIEESINQLLSAKAFLDKKEKQLRLGIKAQCSTIESCMLPERKIVRSSPISGRYDEEDFSVAAEFSLRLKKLFHLYDSFGSRISVDRIKNNEFDSYDSFFAYCPNTAEAYDEILPAGKYLQAFCVGEWEKLSEVYRSILLYAEDHGLTLTGFAYKEGLNEMAIKAESDYVTMITIQCRY